MNCRVCSSHDLSLVVDLGMQPWCNHFLDKDEIGLEPYYPLRLVYCHSCRTSQLDFTVKKEIMFGDHTYLSGITTSLSEHFKKIANEVNESYFHDVANKSVLDIGSNDGTQLKHFKELGFDVLGVESSKKTAEIANQSGVPTVNAFFNLDTLKSIGKKFDVVNASGVFFHLEELHSVCEGIRAGLNNDGIFVVQFLYMKSIMENVAFDQIYHEHLLYYTLETIEVLLNQHSLSMFDAYLAPIHGGSIIAHVCHKGSKQESERLKIMREHEQQSGCNEYKYYVEFAKKITQMKIVNVEYLNRCKNLGKRVFGFGAPVKGNTMLNYFNVGPDLIECLVEKNTLRRGLYSPGMHIPIKMEDELAGDRPNIYYVLAWNFKDEILKNNRQLINSGVEFYFPVNP